MNDRDTQTEALTLAVHSPGRTRGSARYPIPHADTRDATMWAKTIELLWPWRRYQYRGYSTEAAEALTISKVTAQRWLYDGRRHIPPYCGRKIAALCLSRGKALIQIGEAWLRYSDDQAAAHKANKKNPPACPPGGFLTSKKR